MTDDLQKSGQRPTGATDQPAQTDAAVQGESNDAAPNSAQDNPTNGHRKQTQPEKPGDRPDRAGADSRQRGWYWHWNGIVTQYAPLIGLKGVGLLNSYTVWTDRREYSPYRGYAFPSQQSEASFYGEDRAELITINKILVALDLIEIRKEMVTKPDAQGRRWKVPHNFYRVKDRGDGLGLTTADVLRVVELATRDPAVYRYIRKIFWSRFEPIDRDNVWHTILREIADDPSWQRLAERARKQERKASERTKAGHRSRKRSESSLADSSTDSTQPTAEKSDGNTPSVAILTSGQLDEPSVSSDEQRAKRPSKTQTIDESTNDGLATDVEPSNKGLAADVAEGNRGLSDERTSSDEPANNGRASSVASSNTMYYQDHTTTTTTTTRRPRSETGGDSDGPGTLVLADLAQPKDTPMADAATPDHLESSAAGSTPDSPSNRETGRRPADPPAGQANGPVGDPSPLVVSLFEAANDRPATRLERILLSELERDADLAAQPNGSDGARWVAAAIREAVASGSSFVAPKRIGEIIGRWAAEEDGPASQRKRPNRGPLAADRGGATGFGTQGRDVLRYIKQALETKAYRRWFSAVQLVESRSDSLTFQVPDSAIEQKIAADYLSIVERAAAEVYGRPMRVLLRCADSSVDDFVTEEQSPTVPQAQQPVLELGRDDLTQAQQLWNLVIEDLQHEIHHTALDRIRNVVPLGVDPEGQILLGATGRLAERALQSSTAVIARSLAHILGQDHPLKIVPRDGWRTVSTDL